MRPSIRKPFYLFLFFLLLAFCRQAAAQDACAVSITPDGPINICEGGRVTLTATVGAGITALEWYIQDAAGNATATGNTTRTIAASTPGTYYVVASGQNCAEKRSNEYAINVTPIPSEPVFSNSPSSAACAGQPISFEILSAEEGVEYIWDFGDNGTARGSAVSHTYQVTGTTGIAFNVSVVAVRQPGTCQATFSRAVSVLPLPEISFAERKDFQLCVPDTVNPDSLNVHAVLANTTPEPFLSSITGYTIDWGDGNGPQPYTSFADSITSPNPYQKVGDYPIIITATNTSNCSVTLEQVYALSQKPKAHFTLDKQPAETPPNCTPVIVALGDSSTGGGNMTYKWNIRQPNNGGYSIVYGGLDQDSLQFRFEVPGVYNIELIVENGCGSDTTEQSVVVGYPQVQLPPDVEVCGDTTLTYNAQNTMIDPNLGQISKYEWFLTGPGNIRYQSSEEYPKFPALTRPGVYTVSARVTNDCGTSDDIGPPQPQRITVLAVPQAPVLKDLSTCAGDSVTITPAGTATATYQWYDQESEGTLLFTGSAYTTPALSQTTTYYVQAVNGQNCSSARVPVTVTVAPAIDNNIITAAAESVCAGVLPGAIAGSEPTGGAGKYNFRWESSTTNAETGFTLAPGASDGQNYKPAAIAGTTWFRRIVTATGCGADTSAVVQISVNPAIDNNSISASQQVCSGTAPQELTGNGVPAGGNGTFAYLWLSSTSGATAGFAPAAGVNTGSGYTPPPLSQNTWFRRVVSSGGCADTSAVVAITVTPVPAVPVPAVRNAVVCLNSSVTLAVQNPVSGSTYEWYTQPSGGDIAFVGAEFPTPALTQAATYYVQAVNASGCTSSSRASVNVSVITLAASAGEDVTIIQYQKIALTATGGATYTWEPALGLSNPNVANPVASPDKTTTYTVTVTTEEGCTATDEVTVTVIPAISVPNAFSPNHDGVNELWEIGNIHNYPDVRVEIFNRWGNIIYTSNGYGTPWDGTYNGKELPSATYYYMIYLNKSEKPISGNVTLIR